MAPPHPDSVPGFRQRQAGPMHDPSVDWYCLGQPHRGRIPWDYVNSVKRKWPTLPPSACFSSGAGRHSARRD